MRALAACVAVSALGCAEPTNAPPPRPGGASSNTLASIAAVAPPGSATGVPVTRSASSAATTSPAADAAPPEPQPVARRADAGPPVALPGTCEDPDAVIRRAHGAGWSSPSAAASDGADLDDDGVTDIVYNGAATNLTHDVFLFVRRGGCAHGVGKLTTEAVRLTPTSSKSHGLFDLEGDEACPVDCCRTGFHFVFRFDGTRYRAIGKKPVTRECKREPPPAYVP